MEHNGITYKNKAIDHVDELESLLGQVIDTEIGIDIVNLGLVYEIDLDQAGHCQMRITFTSAGCPCAADILDGIHAKLGQLDWISDLDILIVWEPAWEISRITRIGRLSLGINPGR